MPHLDPTSDLAYWLVQLNLGATAIFTAEFVFKVIAYGFACTPQAYIQSSWNRLDFTIVVISLLVLFADSIPALKQLRTLRLLRVLRPLRLLSRIESMKVIIIALVK